MAGEQSEKIAHPGFGGIEGAAILFAHPALDSYLRPCK